VDRSCISSVPPFGLARALLATGDRPGRRIAALAAVPENVQLPRSARLPRFRKSWFIRVTGD